ncbi:hypothetical protein BGX23_004582 [Mortierella sp. AD031]|nr:hypothetical protein BGX23_004582 [Mortierella sp. AD031]
MLTALMELHHLQVLELRIEGVYIVTLLEAIARHCPDSLTSLAIKIKDSGSDTPRLPVIRPIPDINLPAWRNLSGLYEFTVEIDGHGEPEESILPVGHRHHILKHIPMVLLNCPRLRLLKSSPREYAENVGAKLHALILSGAVGWVSDDLSTVDIIIRDIDDEAIGHKGSADEIEYDGHGYDSNSGVVFSRFCHWKDYQRMERESLRRRTARGRQATEGDEDSGAAGRDDGHSQEPPEFRCQ